MVKLFVGGFPLDISELELVQLFNLHGDVATIKIVRDKKTRMCKGYTFLEMKDQEGADRAIEALDNTPMQDRMLKIRIVEPPLETPTSTASSGSPAFNRKYVKVERPSGLEKKKRPRRQG